MWQWEINNTTFYWVICWKNMKAESLVWKGNSDSAISTIKCQKGSRTLGTFWIPEEVCVLVGNSIFMLRKGLGIKPNLFALSRMAVFKDFDLIIHRNLFPLSNMLIFTNLRGLGAFLAMETKERAILLFEGDSKQFWECWCSFDSLLLTGAFTSRSARRWSLGFDLWSTDYGIGRDHDICGLQKLGVWIGRSAVRNGNRNWTFHDVVFDVWKKSRGKLDNVHNQGGGELRYVIPMLRVGRKT